MFCKKTSSIKELFKNYFLVNHLPTSRRNLTLYTTPHEIVIEIEKLSLKQREQLGMYGIV